MNRIVVLACQATQDGGIDSWLLKSLKIPPQTGWNDTPIHTLFLAPMDCLKKSRRRICKRLRGQGIFPRNRYRQSMQLVGPVVHIELSYSPARQGIDSWAPGKVYKYVLRIALVVFSMLIYTNKNFVCFLRFSINTFISFVISPSPMCFREHTRGQILSP